MMRDSHLFSGCAAAAATAVAAVVMMVSAEAQNAPRTPSAAGPAANAARVLVWPMPPEPARIRYIASYHGADDFSKKKPSRWRSLIMGDDPASAKPPDQLVKPYGVAASLDGMVYVTDTASRRVFVFDLERKAVSFIGDKEPAKLAKPTGIAVDAAGTIFVADATLNRIFAFRPDGTAASVIGRDGDLESPAGMAIDQTRHLLYVADSKKHQVFCYSTVDGSAVRTIGKRGGDSGEFNFPTNVSVDGDGRLYVTDTLNFRIQIFDVDGKPAGAFGTLGDTPGSLNRPKGLSVDGEGHVYVADTSFNNFQIFDTSGQLLLYVGSVGSGPGEFYLPAGMFIDRRDRVYVVDQGNARVQVFQYVRTVSQ